MTPLRIRRDHPQSGVSAVVAIILLVGITVVLTGFLYIIVINLSKGAEDVPPRVLLTNVGNPAGEADFQVSAAEVRPLSEFQFRLWTDGVLDAASIMNPVSAGTAGNVTFGDFDSGGTMTEGDTVVVQTLYGHAYQLVLLWKGHVVSDVEWST